MEASRDGCHAPTVAGISGNEKEGCWSIALSGGYEDDVDEGYCFTYTGSGGRDLKGTKAKPKNLRTAPQSSDQTLTGLNLALKVSCDTGKPVRVIRGFKGTSKWAPMEGYRYTSALSSVLTVGTMDFTELLNIGKKLGWLDIW